MDDAYRTWIGEEVVLQMALEDSQVPLRGKLLKDNGETLRLRVGEGWDIDIYKSMVLAVEEDTKIFLPV
jgi:hypothetical protein